VAMYGIHKLSYSTMGSVSTWMGECLQSGKTYWYITRHPGQLSLAIPPWVSAISTVKATAYCMMHKHPWSGSVSWCLVKSWENGDQHSPFGSISILLLLYLFVFIYIKICRPTANILRG